MKSNFLKNKSKEPSPDRFSPVDFLDQKARLYNFVLKELRKTKLELFICKENLRSREAELDELYDKYFTLFNQIERKTK